MGLLNVQLFLYLYPYTTYEMNELSICCFWNLTLYKAHLTYLGIATATANRRGTKELHCLLGYIHTLLETIGN